MFENFLCDHRTGDIKMITTMNNNATFVNVLEILSDALSGHEKTWTISTKYTNRSNRFN